ncbi:hypothetical protein [Candidatus Methanocrinis natronophilus]|uniref:Uncharacterized protein n=1 Tax=Candidatus Methanocrinis natronophilus TaxID=3033396 RepID=A0ABT5X693_9EURY|nr:hypothetical protein [Candidatus Methanocrinis natronophilus]MDF0590173.1 hypothetical protein [Candidatus Methanocrinis natronophilus]
MFKLGEYDEFEAADIAAHLKGAGVKVDLKPVISASVESAIYLEGKESELRERIEEFEVYDRYIVALKAALAEGVEAEGFTDLYLSLLDPSWKEKMERMAGFLGDGAAVPLEGYPSPTGAVERARDLLEMLEAIQFMGDALQLNEIDLHGGAKAEMGDDPVLRIPVDAEEVDPDDELARSLLTVRLEKWVDLRLDEMTAPLAKNLEDEFIDEYPIEYYKISSIGMTMERLIDPPESGAKIEMEEFADLLVFEEDMDDFVMMVDGSGAAEEIARILNKEGVIKIKSDKISWKR